MRKGGVMKNYAVLFVLVLFIFSCGGGLETPENLANIVFKALQIGDFEAYKNCIPNADDAKIYMERIISEAKLSEKDLEKFKKRFEKRLSKMVKKISRDIKKNEKYFNKVLDKAKNAGINWEEAELKDVKYEIKDTKRAGIILKTADIYMSFMFTDSIYIVKLDNCIKLNRGWLISSRIRWKGVSRDKKEGMNKRPE